MNHDDRRTAGSKQQTQLSDTREALLAVATPRGQIVRRPLTEVDSRTLAEGAVAPVDVPGYDRAAMDGCAVRASNTFGAGGRSPNVLRIVDDPVESGIVARVHTGSDVPKGADAVMMIEHTKRLDGRLEVLDALAEGEDVGERGENVREGTPLFEAGYELRPSDIDLLRPVGVREVTLFERPHVSIVPTGEELIEPDPGPGEVIETNDLTVSWLVECWDGEASYRDIVVDDANLLHEAIESNLGHDAVVTTSESSVSKRDLIPGVINGIGEVLVHGVALKPGHSTAVDVVEDTPIVMLPGYPVACVVNTFQFLRPVLKHVDSFPERPLPTQGTALTKKLLSSPGTRTSARIKLNPSDDESTAKPTRANESGILSSIALVDDWVVIPEEIEGYDKGDTIAVEGWEWFA